eukprot:7335872-Ditylum_brightwellii.AAC.1
MAMAYAAWVYNYMPARENGLSSNDIWLRSKDPRLKDTLELKLQKSGVMIPKWAARSRRGTFMGFSPKHSTL